MSQIKNSYLQQQKSNKTHAAKIDLEPEEHLSVPEDNQTCMSTIKNKFEHYTDVIANYFECTRIFSSDKLQEMRRKSAQQQLESDHPNNSSKTKSQVSHESQKFSQFQSKSQFKNYTRKQKEVYILDYNELPVHNYSSNQKLRFNKRYAENYESSYSERAASFCYSFQEVHMERLRQYEKKSKNCWEELKRLLCCRGGNYLEELDEIETDAVSQVPAMITRVKGKQPSLKATPQDNIFLFEQNNTPPELPFTKPNKKKNNKGKLNGFQNNNSQGSQQKKSIFEKQGQFGQDIFSHQVNQNHEHLSDQRYQEEAIKNKEKNKHYINYNESVINVNTNRSRDSAVMDSYRQESQGSYAKKEPHRQSRADQEYNETPNSHSNQVLKRGSQRQNNPNSSSDHNRNQYNSSSYENLAAYNDQEYINYEDQSNPNAGQNKHANNASNNKSEKKADDYNRNMKINSSQSFENDGNLSIKNDEDQQYKSNSNNSANTLGTPSNNRYSEHDTVYNDSLNSMPNLITKPEIPASYSQGKRLKSKKNKGFKFDSQVPQTHENDSSHFSQNKPVLFNDTPDSQIQAEYQDGSQEAPSFKAHKKSKKNNLMMKQTDSVDYQLNDIPELNEQKPYVETSAFKKKRKDKKSKSHTVPIFQENQQDQIDIIYEENQQQDISYGVKGATVGVDENENENELSNAPQQMFKKQKKNKRKNLMVTNKDEQDTYDLEEI